jgi:hypothetical protein
LGGPSFEPDIGPFRRARANDTIQAARSAASVRVSDMSDIFGCGSSMNTILSVEAAFSFAIVANTGAWSVEARRQVAETASQASHYR